MDVAPLELGSILRQEFAVVTAGTPVTRRATRHI
jgi:hypothetical protein